MQANTVSVLFLFLYATCAALAGPSGQKPTDCPAHAIRSDQCLQELTMTRVVGFKFPATERQLLTETCSKLEPQLSCVSSYRNCLRTVQRTAFDTVSRNLKRFFRGTCKSRDLRVKTVTNLNCFKSNAPLKRMSDEFTLLLELSANQTSDDWLKYTCCSYHYVQSRVKSTVRDECARRGVETESNFFLDAMR